ncbi:MAG: right-handed parallel beta-helix repeat-containing protein, partial [Deltaproteobacteria bacterium]|nr:right-handed parallel beta-helix repeat-containing protein [Deltaproteobacteria bacterium]
MTLNQANFERTTMNTHLPFSIFTCAVSVLLSGQNAMSAELNANPANYSQIARQAAPGDVVLLEGGIYDGNLSPSQSGTPDAWITFKAAPGALPVFDGADSPWGSGVGNGSTEYVRYEGIVAKNYSSGGFGNGWTSGSCTQDTDRSNGHLQFVNCIADNNGINGIAFYCAQGILIENSIIAHNGNQLPSWSSGVNLFHTMGEPSDNIVRGNISFENTDISEHQSDGSGYIVDQNSEGGAIFQNNIGFHNGGSCIRITNSADVQLINNTCIHNGQDENLLYHDEIFYSDSTSRTGSLLLNNLCIPTEGQAGLKMGDGVEARNNIFDGVIDLVTAATGDLDFHLQATATAAIDQGGEGAPSMDNGFDWGCIMQAEGDLPWWQYAVNYDYIE